MLETLRAFSDELKAGLINLSGLRRIEFGIPASQAELDQLETEFPSWPLVLIGILSCYNGITFHPNRGRFYRISEICKIRSLLHDQGVLDLDNSLAIFGEDLNHNFLALNLSGRQAPGMEPVVAIRKSQFDKGGIFNPEIRLSNQYLDDPEYVL